MHDTLTPDISLGTHFFNELVEMNMLYFALFHNRPGNRLDAGVFEGAPSRLADYAPNGSAWSDVVRVIEPSDPVRLVADPRAQTVMCYRMR